MYKGILSDTVPSDNIPNPLYYKNRKRQIVGARILITGGTGSLGQVLVKTLIDDNHITVLSRNPHNQYTMRQKYGSRASFVLGDIANQETILTAFEGQDIVIHCAALKVLQMGESDPAEYLRVNVNGTTTVAKLCKQNQVAYCLFISSDKAVSPIGTYGVSKRIGEQLWLSHNKNHTAFSALRYGNVMNSNGGVWSIWQERVKTDLPLIVREPEPTRFFMRKTEAVNLVIDTLENMNGGEIFVPGNMPAFSLWDLARQLQNENHWVREPLGPGEKQHEVLVAPTEHITQSNDHPNLWYIDPKKVNNKHEVAAQFCSATAQRLSGAEVVRRLSE